MYVCMYVCVHECVYVAQRASERHREAQRGPERPREPIVHMYVERPRMSERGWNKPVTRLAGWLGGWLAG